MSDDERNKIETNHAEGRRQRVVADWNDAIAGRETGRIKPLVGQNAAMSESAKEKSAKETAEFLTNLQTLLHDPEYAKLYHATGDLLREAELAVEQELSIARQALAGVQYELDDMLDTASQLPDGTRIFKDAGGNVFTEKGRFVDEEEAASIIWLEGAVSYEVYLVQRRGLEKTQARLNDLEGHQSELGEMRDRYDDENSPPSKEDLESMKESSKQILDHLNAQQVAPAHDQESQSAANTALPELDL